MKKFEFFLKRIFLSLLLLLMKQKKSETIPSFNSTSRVLFVRLNRIGDALVTTPLLTSFCTATGAEIDVLADEKNHFVFSNVSAVRRVKIFRKGLKDFREIIKDINASKYDAVVDLHDDISTTVSYLLAFIKAPHKIGFAKGNDNVYTLTVKKPDATKVHIIDRMLAFSEVLGFTPNKNSLGISFSPSEAALKKAKDFVASRFPQRKFLLGINISAGSDARYWGTENFRKLVKYISGFPVDIVPLSSTRDLKFAFAIFEDKSKIFYTPIFEEFAAIMNEIDMLFSPDTATIHLASIYRKPVFGLYVKYMTNDMIWSPYGCDFDCVITTEPTLKNISFAQVEEKFGPFLNKYLNK